MDSLIGKGGIGYAVLQKGYLDGVAAGDVSGRSVATAGDVNGDGIQDIIIGAYGAAPGGLSRAGKTLYV